MQHRNDLDGLRGVACLSVLILHILLGPIEVDKDSTFFAIRFAIQPFMVGGVDLFFVLSGFLIVGILMENKQASNYFTTFWRRRIGRIFPVYYLMFAIVLVIYAIDAIKSTGLTRALLFNQLPAWTYLTFTQNFYVVATGVGGNFLGVTWSLAMEEQFYLILPFAVFFLRNERFVAIAIVLIILAPVVRTFLWDWYGWRASYHLSPARMDTVLWGAFIAYAVRRQDWIAILSKRTWLIDATIVGLALLVVTNTFHHISAPFIPTDLRYLGLFLSTLRYSALATMYALIILRLYLPGAVTLKSTLSHPILMRIGLLSYAAYMYHQIINTIVHYLAHGGTLKLASWEHFWIPILVFALTFSAAALSYRYMERPIQIWARKAKYDRPKHQSGIAEAVA